MPAQVHALRTLLDQRFPDTAPLVHATRPVLATGIAALDGALPGGGLPRGRLTAWAPGHGATALLLAACRAALSRGERAAWIDTAGTIANGWEQGPLLLRPGGGRLALECAEDLLRCGGFALVVLTGAPARDRQRIRLGRIAREGGSALVVSDDDGFGAALRVSARTLPGDYRWTPGPCGEPAEFESVTVRVTATALGWSRSAEIPIPILPYELRLSLEPCLVDRRGAAR